MASSTPPSVCNAHSVPVAEGTADVLCVDRFEHDMAARLTLLGARLAEKLSLHPTGRLAPSTLTELDERMRRVLGLG